MAGAGEGGRSLDQQSRFTDPRIAADQENRAAYEAPTGDAVQFSDPGRQAGRVMRLAGERLQREQAASARLAARARWALGAFLAQRVPFPAGLALSLPAAEGGTAVLADEGQIAFRHRESPENSAGRR